ncbi:immunity 49 family protein [Lentzea sp. NPDC006480]|uniref:immunity 49 family protein n=1 Tax=Lentzea sp. NPDC006480 TaxID=3157176 RepID=UPI0033B53815
MIPRHEIDLDFSRAQVDTLQRLIESALDDVETDPDALSAVRKRALMRFEHLTALDPAAGEDETWQAAVFASQAANAVFARTSKAEDVVRYRLGDREYALPVLGPNHHATPVDWVTAAFLAVVTRSEEHVAELCKVGKYTLRGSGAQVEAYVHPWVETLQRHLGGDQVPPALLESVIDLTDPGRASFASPDFMLLVAHPPVNVLFRVLRGTAEEFNDALVQAATAHRDYWRRADFAANPDGFVAVGALAMAILGRNKGFPVEVESGYLPENLVNGSEDKGFTGDVKSGHLLSDATESV